MSNENAVSIFERAVRSRLRIETAVGNLSVEDVWDLPLTSARNISLDDVARQLHRQLKDAETESFVVKTSSADVRQQLAFDIVKHVIDVKLAEAEVAKTRAENREKKQKLLSLISEKQDASLSEKSVEELQAMVEAL